MKVLTWMLLKKPKFDHFTKKMGEQKNQVIGPLVYFQMFQKFLYGKTYSYFDKYFQGINAVFVKVLAPSISF